VGFWGHQLPHKDRTELHYICLTASMDSITPLQILHFFEVFSLAEVQVGVLPKAWVKDANVLSNGSLGVLAKATLQADDGAQVCFFLGCGAAGHDGADDEGAGGAGGGGLVASSFSLWGKRGAIFLPFPSTTPVPLLAPLDKGHRCHFTVLCDVNLHPQKSQVHCGQPSTASSACFWHSHLNAQFLFHASHFFSFWAAEACLSPLERSKKARFPSSLRSSKMYTNITFLTLEIGQGMSATAHLTRWA
jgi:hypothetical protein